MCNAWRVLGIEESDGERCECCNTPCPKRRIVLTDGEVDVRYGTSCAALKLHGNKKSGSVKSITTAAKAASYAAKWLKVGRSPESVAKAVWNYFGYSTEAKVNGVDIRGVGMVTA